MSFNLLPFDHEDIIFALPSLNQISNSLLLIDTFKNVPSHSLTSLDRRQQQKMQEEEDSLGIQIGQLSQSNNIRKKKTGCTCKKTNCLKRYCECFSMGKICSSSCACYNCYNTHENDELIKQTKTEIKCRSSRKGGHGCICKKSQCKKKYCQCFNSGSVCSDACKCVDCQNKYIFVNQIKDEGCNSQKSLIKLKEEKQSTNEGSKLKQSQVSFSYFEVISALDQ